MRIGINASFLRKPGTGIGQVTFNFLEKLKELPTDGSVEFFVYTEEAFLGENFPKQFHFRNFLPLWRRDDLIRKMLWERRVAREAKRDGCDAFLSLYQSSMVTPQGMKHTMVVHDVIPRLFPEYQGNMRQKLYWRRVERGIRQADYIVAVSESTKRDVMSLGVDLDQVSVGVPDTAPRFRVEPSADERARVMERYGLTPGYIYHGGGLEVRKNTEGVLRAYQALVEEEAAGSDMELPPLVISGRIFPEDNLLATPVKKIIQDVGLHEHVRLLGFVPENDLPALYKEALFFVYPSRYEGFGLPVLEALRMGTPVLTSDRASLPEVAGAAALYVDPADPVALVTAMKRLLRDKAFREQLRAAASQVTKRFGWEHFVQTILETFQKEKV